MARQGAMEQESRHPQCCKSLEVGRRHECDCQLKGRHKIIDATLDPKWKRLYTQHAIHLGHTDSNNWYSIGKAHTAALDYSLTPWDASKALPSKQLRHLWVEVIEKYRRKQIDRL